MISDIGLISSLISTLIAILSFFMALRPTNEETGQSRRSGTFRAVCVVVGISCLAILGFSVYSSLNPSPDKVQTSSAGTNMQEDTSLQTLAAEPQPIPSDKQENPKYDSEIASAPNEQETLKTAGKAEVVPASEGEIIESKSADTAQPAAEADSREDTKFTGAALYEQEDNGSMSNANEIELNTEITGISDRTGDYDLYKVWISKPGTIYIDLSHEKLNVHQRIWSLVLNKGTGIMNKIDIKGTDSESQLKQYIQYADDYFFIEIIPDANSGEYLGTEYHLTVSFEEGESPL